MIVGIDISKDWFDIAWQDADQLKNQRFPYTEEGMAQLLDQLRDMNVRLVDSDGAALGGGKGSDVLGHPLNAVVWLAGALKADGLSLKPGQLISLGSFSALLPPKSGLRATVHYDGVHGLQPVTVSFR